MLKFSEDHEWAKLDDDIDTPGDTNINVDFR